MSAQYKKTPLFSRILKSQKSRDVIEKKSTPQQYVPFPNQQIEDENAIAILPSIYKEEEKIKNEPPQEHDQPEIEDEPHLEASSINLLTRDIPDESSDSRRLPLSDIIQQIDSKFEIPDVNNDKIMIDLLFQASFLGIQENHDQIHEKIQELMENASRVHKKANYISNSSEIALNNAVRQLAIARENKEHLLDVKNNTGSLGVRFMNFIYSVFSKLFHYKL